MGPEKLQVIEAPEARVDIPRLRAAALGLLAGVMNGLIALGGGVLITPALVIAGVSPLIAVGTSLAAVTMLSCIGFAAHLLVGAFRLASFQLLELWLEAPLALCWAREYSRGLRPIGC